MDTSRSEILTYLSVNLSHWSTYHNHKETSAWAGVVLYIPFVALFINILGNAVTNSTGLKIVATIVFLLTWLAAFFYIRQQFKLRSRSADLIAACLSLTAKIISRPNERIDPATYSLITQGDTKFQSSHFLAKAILVEADVMEGRGRGARRTLEASAYCITVLALLLALLSIWAI